MHIVSHHRSALDIESEPGQGSVFTVHLPAGHNWRLKVHAKPSIRNPARIV